MTHYVKWHQGEKNGCQRWLVLMSNWLRRIGTNVYTSTYSTKWIEGKESIHRLPAHAHTLTWQPHWDVWQVGVQCMVCDLLNHSKLQEKMCVCVCACAETSRTRGCAEEGSSVCIVSTRRAHHNLCLEAPPICQRWKRTPRPPGSSTVTPWPSYLIMLSPSLVTCDHNKAAFPPHFKQTDHSDSSTSC